MNGSLTITLDGDLASAVREAVRTGSYATDGDFVREAVRRESERTVRLRDLRKDLAAAEDSADRGETVTLDLADLRRTLRRAD